MVQSPIEERLTWPVRAVLLGGGGRYGHFLPDLSFKMDSGQYPRIFQVFNIKPF